MKASEFRKLIREEITKVLSEVKKVEVEIGPLSDKAVARNAKLELIIKSFIKNVKQEKGYHDTYWLVGTFDKNEFAKAKEKYSLTIEKDSDYFAIKYKNNNLVLRPVSSLSISNKDFGNLIGYATGASSDKLKYKVGDSVKDWEGNAVGKVLHVFKNGNDLEQTLMKDKDLKATIKWSLSSAKSLSDYLNQYEDSGNRQPHYIIKNGSKMYALPQEDLE